jgi:hypothetical protein
MSIFKDEDCLIRYVKEYIMTIDVGNGTSKAFANYDVPRRTKCAIHKLLNL